jgi:hypothetical protein
VVFSILTEQEKYAKAFWGIDGGGEGDQQENAHARDVFSL